MASEFALLELGVLLGLLAVAGSIARWIGQSVIPLYMLVGMAAGPFVAGRLGPVALEATEFVELGAELGIVLLLAFLGLEFNLDRLLADREHIGRAGTVDFLVNFGVGFLLGYLLFDSVVGAVLLAGIVYISSSAIISKSLIDIGWIANDEAGPMLGTLVYEDIVIAIYLVFAYALVQGGEGPMALARSVAVAVGFLLVLVFAVAKGGPVLQRLLDTDSREQLVLRSLGVLVPVAGLALALGVSEAVAAFFVGMAFSATEHVERIERLLEPIRDVFAAVFFVWIGLVADPLLIASAAVPIAAAVLVTTPTKLLTGFYAGRVYDLSTRRSTRVGLGMVSRGEFSLIVGTIALGGSTGLLGPELASTIYAVAVGYVIVMSVLGTMLMARSEPIEQLVCGWLDS